jgi:hypothetical protein
MAFCPDDRNRLAARDKLGWLRPKRRAISVTLAMPLSSDKIAISA